MAAVTYRTADVDGLPIFYREAGAAAAPHLLLLHGFPSASYMFQLLTVVVGQGDFDHQGILPHRGR